MLKNFKQKSPVSGWLILAILASWILWVLVYVIFLFPLINNGVFSTGVHSYLGIIHLFPMIIIPWALVMVVSKIKKGIPRKN